MDRLDDLKALRVQMLIWINEAPVDRKAALIAQFRAILAEISELAPKEETGDSIDEIAARRAARRTRSTPRANRTKRSG